MVIFGWIIGILLILIGLGCAKINLSYREITQAEVNMMKEDGKFEGEPYWMKDFRVSRSEGDLQDNIRHGNFCRIPIFIGIIIIFITTFF